MEPMNKQQKKDISVIAKFVEVYCAGKHRDTARSAVALPAGVGDRCLCPECASFLKYTVTKRLNCPLEADKPSCKHCRIHCYDKQHRQMVREIMSYSGRKLLLSGRVDYLWHYLF
jgi:hypothetical protein